MVIHLFEYLKEILTQIANSKMMPNIMTLNAVLQVISGFKSSQAKVKAKSTIAEFSSLGIKPSLTSYYFLLMIFYRESNCFPFFIFQNSD